MADKITIEFDKALQADLIRRIKKVDSDLKKRKLLLSIYRQASKDMVKTAKNLAPVGKDFYNGKPVTYPIKRFNNSYDKTNLQKSIKFNAGRNKKMAVGYVGIKRKKASGSAITGDGWYRHMVVYGTKYQSGNNFFSRAVSASRAVTFTNITKGLDRRIDTVAKQNKLSK